MSFNLRPYQIKALETIDRDLKLMPEVLVSGITGCGKTTIFSRLINKYYKITDKTFLVLVHKQEVVKQIYDTILDRTDVHFKDLGICCASLNQKIIDRRVTVASIQTFVNMKDKYQYADLIVIDEVHKVDINSNSQYKICLDYLRLQKPNCRILGFTSTTARMGHGYIYGDRCKKGAVNLFPVCNHKITYEELRNAGYLVPLKGVVAKHESMKRDLEDVNVSGDFCLSELSEVMTQARHLDTAVEAIEKYCGDYKKICVFACTINHAEQLKELLGDQATTVHSGLNSIERLTNMNDWKSGKKRIVTSCMMLTEGVDVPDLECLVFARPTLSSTLWLQAVGRVLRISPDKDHGFLVDVTLNSSKFGLDLDNVKITIPKSVEAAEAKKKSIFKICPSCETEMHIALRECPDCGFIFEAADCIIAEALPEMKEVTFEKQAPVWYDVLSYNPDWHTSKKSKKQLGRIDFVYAETEYVNAEVTMWLCFPDNYSGFAVQMAKEKWEMISDEPFPESCDEFAGCEFKQLPMRILVDENDKFPQLVMLKSMDHPDMPSEVENIPIEMGGEFIDDLPF